MTDPGVKATTQISSDLLKIDSTRFALRGEQMLSITMRDVPI